MNSSSTIRLLSPILAWKSWASSCRAALFSLRASESPPIESSSIFLAVSSHSVIRSSLLIVRSPNSNSVSPSLWSLSTTFL